MISVIKERHLIRFLIFNNLTIIFLQSSGYHLDHKSKLLLHPNPRIHNNNPVLISDNGIQVHLPDHGQLGN